jgi:hypothetical protein
MGNQFDMACPVCGRDDAIDVAATVWVRLTPDGTDTDESNDGSHEWDGDSAALCNACGHSGTVGEFSEESESVASARKAAEARQAQVTRTHRHQLTRDGDGYTVTNGVGHSLGRLTKSGAKWRAHSIVVDEVREFLRRADAIDWLDNVPFDDDHYIELAEHIATPRQS